MTEPRRWRASDHLPSVVLFAAGVAIAVGIAELVRRDARADRVAVLERRASDIAATVTASQLMWLEVLHQLESFFRSSDEVTRADFRDFVRPALERHPAIAAIEWFPLTAAAERAALEARAHADGLPGFRVREQAPDGTMIPAAERAAYLPLLYMEPMNDTALGLDLLATELRAAPAVRARDTGLPVVSPRLQLVEDPAGVWSVAVHMPIYRRGASRSTEAERRRAFAGVVVEIFRLQPTLTKALTGVDVAELEVVLEDRTAGAEARLLHGSTLEVAPGAISTDRPVPFAGRAWTLRFDAAAEGGGIAPAAVLVAGAGASLVAALLLSAWRMILRLRREVAAARSVGQYTLHEKLGSGGMGVVYKASHALLRRPTAVKILLRERANEADMKRFEREVQITGRLTHPNTVVVFDYGRTPDGRFYYAMEYIDGVTLERLVTQFGPQPPGRVVHILAQACGALAEAHAAGLIHRDVKPANFMLCQRGGVPDFLKVLDFGMVKEGGIVSDVSDTGVSYGTPLYLSPEAIKDPRAIDQRADLYALGLLGYFLLAGVRAVSGGSIAEVMHQHLDVVPPPPSARLGMSLPAGLDAVIMRCLAKDPDDRPSSAPELRAELLALAVPPWTTEDAATWWAERHVVHTPPEVSATEPRPLDVSMDER